MKLPISTSQGQGTAVRWEQTIIIIIIIIILLCLISQPLGTEYQGRFKKNNNNIQLT